MPCPVWHQGSCNWLTLKGIMWWLSCNWYVVRRTDLTASSCTAESANIPENTSGWIFKWRYFTQLLFYITSRVFKSRFRSIQKRESIHLQSFFSSNSNLHSKQNNADRVCCKKMQHMHTLAMFSRLLANSLIWRSYFSFLIKPVPNGGTWTFKTFTACLCVGEINCIHRCLTPVSSGNT